MISLTDIAYLNLYHSVETPDPNSIFKPGAFESLVITLIGAVATGLGLFAGIIFLKISCNKSLTWAAIAVNAFCGTIKRQ